MNLYWLKYRGTRFPVRRGETVVGRSPYCTIVLSNTLASRQHCALRFGPDGLTIVDLGSSNGTLVNGELVRGERRLEPGDVVRVGTDLLEVVAGSVEASARERKVTGTSAAESPASEWPTGIHDATLDLVEALTLSAQETMDPVALAGPIERTIEAIVRRTQQSGERFERAAAARLRAVVEIVAAWHTDASRDDWRAGLIGIIAERSER